MDNQTKQEIDQAVEQGITEEDLKLMASNGVPDDEIEYARSLINGEAESTQDNEQQGGQMQSGDQQAGQAQEGYSPEDKETVERFVFNAMNIASGEHYDKMIAMAKSAKGNKAEGVGRAIFFVLSAVKKGMNDKGVKINPDLWLEDNGLIEQTSKIVAILLDGAGLGITQEDVQGGMALAAESLGMEEDNSQQQAQGEMQPPQQVMPQQLGAQ